MTQYPQQPWQPTNPPVPQQPKGWFARHKVLTMLIGGMFLLFLCCGGMSVAFMGDSGSTSAGSSSSSSSDEGTSETSPQEEPAEEPKEEPTEDEPAEKESEKEEPAEEEPTEDEPAEKESEKEEPAEESMTVEQENAVQAARDYLDFMAFSKEGLIDQLSSEAGDGYPEDVARFAVEHIESEVDWNEQAVKSAESYLELMPFSRAELIDQLSSDAGDGFTREQAEYAADQVGL